MWRASRRGLRERVDGDFTRPSGGSRLLPDLVSRGVQEAIVDFSLSLSRRDKEMCPRWDISTEAAAVGRHPSSLALRPVTFFYDMQRDRISVGVGQLKTCISTKVYVYFYLSGEVSLGSSDIPIVESPIVENGSAQNGGGGQDRPGPKQRLPAEAGAHIPFHSTRPLGRMCATVDRGDRGDRVGQSVAGVIPHSTYCPS